MTQGLNHKGYAGSMEISLDDGCLHGRLLFVDDLITYEAADVPSLQSAFTEAVDRYLAHCKSIGKRPDKPCSGSFNVRLGEALHRQAATAAIQASQSLNDFVVKAVQVAVAPPQTVVHEHRILVDELQHLGRRMASSVSGELQWEAHGHTQH